MNKITHNGKTIIQTQDYIEVDGEKTMTPEYVKKSHVKVNSVIDGVITVNGYIFNPESGKFTKENFFQKMVRKFCFF